MAVLTHSAMRGLTEEQAQHIGRFVAGLANEMRVFPGFIAQAAGPIQGGYGVTEVWETQEAHERWVREIIAPRASQQLGVAEIPPATYTPLDNVVTR